jgi:plasmid stabilization system protein ParE
VSQYVLGADAVLDLEDIWDYIASHSVDAADRWIARLFEAFEEIARMPGVGHRREDLTAYPVRFRTVGAYLIIYRVGEPRSVEIVAVTQGSRDIPSFLRRRMQ